MPETLFVYGTLHPDRAPAEIADLVTRFQLIGPAAVHGRLYDLGPYPALILDPHFLPVPGHLFTLPTDPDTLPRLDDYEGYLPSNPTQSLYLRTQTHATLADGTPHRCWIYIYNQPLL